MILPSEERDARFDQLVAVVQRFEDTQTMLPVTICGYTVGIVPDLALEMLTKQRGWNMEEEAERRRAIAELDRAFPLPKETPTNG